MLNFPAMRAGTITPADLAQSLTPRDLHRLTDAMLDTMLAIVHDARDADVPFVPIDPSAHDAFGRSEDTTLAWTLGHVVVHATASAEEAAALASSLARGILPEYRSRAELPWETVTTVVQIRQRLAESRRIRHAFLMTWPDLPDLRLTYTPIPHYGPLNAVARFILGLSHDDAHLDQLREIMRQARAAR